MNDGNRLGTGFFEKSLISDGCVVAEKHYLVFFRHEYYGGPHLPILRQRAGGYWESADDRYMSLTKNGQGVSRISLPAAVGETESHRGYSDYR